MLPIFIFSSVTGLTYVCALTYGTLCEESFLDAPLSLTPSIALLWPIYLAASSSGMRVTMLCSAQQRKAELISAGVPCPSERAVEKVTVTRGELAHHCKRKTRGVHETTQLIEDLILSLSSATDTLGVPLLKEEMKDIWSEQKKHILCIQDVHPGCTFSPTVHTDWTDAER